MWTRGLNPEQANAVQHSYGPLLVLAGAGSGKTTVLVSRTGRIIDEGVARPEEICVLTFTNKAARELKARVTAKLGDKAKGLWSGTFHSFGLRLLRQYHEQMNLPAQFGVIDQSDAQGILKDILKDIKVTGKDAFDVDELLGIINRMRTGESQMPQDDDYKALADVLLPKYIKKMDLMGVVDFEGLLIKPLELFKKNPEVLTSVREKFKFIMVDEFQDTNDLQMQLIEAMAGKKKNVCVVGDDDQSIYGWRGAKISNILDFPKYFAPCEVIRLERNYRSSPAILSAANELISKNKTRHGKVLKPEGKFAYHGIPEAFLLGNEEEEAQFVMREIRNWQNMGYQAKDIAVLYRSNSQGGLLEGHLRHNQIPYTVSGGTGFFDRKEIKDILAYLRFSIAPNDVALRRIINTPSRGIGDTTIERITAATIEKKISFVLAAKQWQGLGIGESTGQILDGLFKILQNLLQKLVDAAATDTAGARLLQFLRDLGYRDYLLKTNKDPITADKKWMMIEIFSRVLDGFMKKGGLSLQSLREFLDAMELRDEVEGEEENKVSLMTLHACKGLEFPCVMIVGVEEDLVPHKTLGTNIDEERRLFYVGLTRAKERLVLSRCRIRTRYGAQKPVSPSRFLLEISEQNLKDYKGEFRPVSSEERQDLLSGFLASLDKKATNVIKK